MIAGKRATAAFLIARPGCGIISILYIRPGPDGRPLRTSPSRDALFGTTEGTGNSPCKGEGATVGTCPPHAPSRVPRTLARAPLERSLAGRLDQQTVVGPNGATRTVRTSPAPGFAGLVEERQQTQALHPVFHPAADTPAALTYRTDRVGLRCHHARTISTRLDRCVKGKKTGR